MASKVLVPGAPFTKLQVKKSPPDPAGSGFIIGSPDAVARVAHLEHSVRFLQEQHRLMLSGLHTEIEALRERNRDLQFQLIFNKESSPKPTSANEDGAPVESNEEVNLKREVHRLEREAAAARAEARAAEARAVQLQRLVDAQAEKLREVEARPQCGCAAHAAEAGEVGGEAESRSELRARLAEAERLVRRLRGDADRQRREVLATPGVGAGGLGGVTNLLFDGHHARHAHLQCMKNSLHASLRASGFEAGYGFQNNYHFPPVHTPDFWREPLREDYSLIGSRGRSTRRPLTLPELTAHPMQRSTVYGNNHTRVRTNGYEHKNKKALQTNGENVAPKTPEESALERRLRLLPDIKSSCKSKSSGSYPELKVVVTKMIQHGHVSNGQPAEAARPRARRPHHRKHAPEHT